MKQLITVTALCALLACHQASKARPAQPKPAVEMQTIDSVDLSRNVLDPPPTLTDVGPAIKIKPNQQGETEQLNARDEAVRASLPFTPAIAMDPVDGSKISIRADTAMVDFKGRIYYFGSAENKAKFVADPQTYMKGAFSHL